DQVVRTEAIRAIGNIGNISYLPQLLQLLKERDISIVTSAIFAIGKLKDPRAEKPLIVLLSHPEPEVRIASAKALAELN
ncbi:MAG: HEAT repeat domain-containing protein, partial [bacterium]